MSVLPYANGDTDPHPVLRGIAVDSTRSISYCAAAAFSFTFQRLSSWGCLGLRGLDAFGGKIDTPDQLVVVFLNFDAARQVGNALNHAWLSLVNVRAPRGRTIKPVW